MKKNRVLKATVRTVRSPINWIGGIPEHLLDPDRDRRPDSPEAVARRKKRRERSRQRVAFETIQIPPEHFSDSQRSAAPDTGTSDKPDVCIADSKDQPAAE